jgi:hypothetical protein
MTDEEQAAWDEMGIGQPPSRDPAGSISKVLVVVVVAIILAFAIAALSACATPAVQTRTVEVKIPVAVHALKPAQVPAVPAPLGPRPQSLSAAADILLSKHCEFVVYVLKADPLLRLSAGLPQQPLVKFPECEK